jgi:hypothetical protein
MELLSKPFVQGTGATGTETKDQVIIIQMRLDSGLQALIETGGLGFLLSRIT